MRPGAFDEVLSSKARLRIADALSTRPRTLNELAAMTGISVQGVLRHLRRMEELGLVSESRLSPSTPKARTVYSAASDLVGDFSTPELTVVKPTAPPRATRRRGAPDLERLSAEILIGKRRVRDEARRLGRMIERVATDQASLSSALDALGVTEKERLILRVVLTEETVEEGARALEKFYGIGDRRSIEGALAKAKRLVSG